MRAGLDIRRSFSRANDEVIRKFSEVINAGRIIVNSPGSIGALGGVYNDMVPTFSFGCGTGGGNSTTDNVNIYHYLNIKRSGEEDTSTICGSAFPIRFTST